MKKETDPAGVSSDRGGINSREFSGKPLPELFPFRDQQRLRSSGLCASISRQVYLLLFRVHSQMLSAWGKTDLASASSHHLAHHSADVAAVFLELLAHPLFLCRAQHAAGEEISSGHAQALGALTFLHDLGKLAPGFQAKGWASGHGIRTIGHLEAGWHWIATPRADALAGSAGLLGRIGIGPWLPALFAHHGRPVPRPAPGVFEAVFFDLPHYDWRAEEQRLGQALLDWFPDLPEVVLPNPAPRLVHFYCGMLTLADWIGSDRRAFPFVPEFDPDYWKIAQSRARHRLRDIGLASGGLHLVGPAEWGMISSHPAPRPAQQAVRDLSTDEKFVLLEAETGAGKTEAALWRFVRLVAAGEVDALYFAVPTRAAARQLHRRVNEALARMFDPAPEAVLAIPGQVVSGAARGKRLPDFSVLWDDAQTRPSRWAAEHAARFLAAQIVVGTVDQVALSGLQVKFAHLRGAALSRALLVIDEVHASDPYMTEVQTAVMRDHLTLGGHVMLMSATLGAAARRRWRSEPVHHLEQDAALPYPAVWTRSGMTPIASDPEAGKTVRIAAHTGWSGADAANLAIAAARKGARVLVIRNTVQRAQETWSEVLGTAPNLLLSVAGRPSLHHSRFAVEDRALLDQAVEAALGKDSPMRGAIVIGTQTLEQSLDICADLLITDLCPMDVLLQRLGRLHRHRRPRPAGFELAQATVLMPEGGLDPLMQRAENGLGAFAGGPSLSGIYVDIPGLEATRLEIGDGRDWQIPAMNRALVEAATHPEALDRIAVERGWQAWRQRVTGRALAEMRAADLVVLDRTARLPETFPDDERIRTRLGEEGAVLELPPGTLGVFGSPVSRIALPAHWSQGLVGDEPVSVEAGPPLRVTISDRVFLYGPEGVRWEKSQ
ncbi:CRISPR-associated helicase Cas3' [Rhodobacter capsulatus]|uniref:CRISPR-associated helicase Cas3' n=1 Tax=Rhodobacter capsulatus TaxID=1061 RepID=UPI00146BEEBE|nr:CRISPR-associated helicase Cas3' [Rhodobacter capsulatus]